MTIQVRCVLCDELYSASEEHFCRTPDRAPVSERRELARKALETIDIPSESKIAEAVEKTGTTIETMTEAASDPVTGAEAWKRHKAYRRDYMRKYRARRAK